MRKLMGLVFCLLFSCYVQIVLADTPVQKKQVYYLIAEARDVIVRPIKDKPDSYKLVLKNMAPLFP